MLPSDVVLVYALVLAVSGVLMLVFGGFGFQQGGLARTVQILAGFGFLAYAVFLAFFFDGGRVGFTLWALIAPVLAAGNVGRARRDRRIAQEQLAATYAAEAADRARVSRPHGGPSGRFPT